MNQVDLQKMAVERLKDAKALLDGGRWEFAYYAAGYAVECALKSCILVRMIHTGLVFKEKWDAKVCLTHDFTQLVDLAGLKDQLINDLTTSAAAGKEFAFNWEIAKAWSVSSRYEAKPEVEAKKLYAAIADEPHGVLQWTRTHW